MSFVKTAKIPLITLAQSEYINGDGTMQFKKTAGSKTASVYQDGKSVIDIQTSINMVAEDYNLSRDPRDYIFEAARAVTAEVPNENGDAFPRQELLRFDHKLGKAVYQTFILKPHHINHRTDNPKTARGFVLDASYNDLAEVMSECPGCSAKTASVEDRDETGLNCKKCGTTVKDEFVELLIAVDTKKDPTFATGVKKGSLNSLSMGCEAGYTDCSICGNRARTVAQFCKHIRSGNKKKKFKTAAGMRVAFEKCGSVFFTEISRVDQPADPTAKQKEVLTPVAQMANETANLLRAVSKSAQVTDGKPPTDVPDGNEHDHDESSEADDVHVIDDLRDGLKEIKETHPDLVEKIEDAANILEKIKESDPEVFDRAEDAVEQENISEPSTIDDYTKEQDNNNKPMSPAEMGIKPEPGGLPAMAASKIANNIVSEFDSLLNNTKAQAEDNTVEFPVLKFAKSYDYLEAQVTDKGNVRVYSPEGSVFVVRVANKPSDSSEARKIATTILRDIATSGLVMTAKKYNAVMSPKIASVLDFHMTDHDPSVDEEGDKGPITDNADGDIPREENYGDSIFSDGDDDMSGDREGNPESVIESRESDHGADDSHPDHVAEAHEGTMDAERSEKPASAIDDEHHDRKASKRVASGLMGCPKCECECEADDKFCRDCGEDLAAHRHEKMKSIPRTKTEEVPLDAIMESISGDGKHGGMDKESNIDVDAAGEFPASAIPGAGGSMEKKGCGVSACSGSSKTAAGGECGCEPGCDCSKEEHCKCACSGNVMKANAMPAMAMTASVREETKKYVSRAERIYKTRIAEIQKKAEEAIDSAEQAALEKISTKFLRAVKLAAKRQALNLEQSPLKAGIFDALTSQMDIDSDSFYPGMDPETASHIVEASMSNSMDEFVDSIVKRAADFVAMGDEAFDAVETDVHNLTPAPVVVQASTNKTAAARDDVRTAAMNGNLVVAPSATNEVVSSGNPRNNIRSALGTTKVRRTTQALFNK